MGGDFKPTLAHTPPASKDVQRHAHASDVQDILPGKAPPGNETTEHQIRRRKPGRKKKHPRNKSDWMPNPYGKYPLSSALKKYLEATRHYYAPTTQKERRRKTRRVLEIMDHLGAPTSPKKVKQEHILKFMDWMAENDQSNETKRKLLRFLKDYLAYYENDIIGTMQVRRMIRMPASKLNEIRSLTMKEVNAIHDASKLFDGWPGSVARFITMVYPYTGLRPTELRTLKIRDISIETWSLVVSHPKGEGRYGVHRRVGIFTPIRPIFILFLEERKEYLEEHGFDENSEPLIPYIRKNGPKQVNYWNYNEIWKIKTTLERLSGVNFKIKDYRSTFCQYLIDNGAKLEAVSKMMGHSSSKTTEQFYGRIRDDDAISEIERVFMEPDAQMQKSAELKISQIK